MSSSENDSGIIDWCEHREDYVLNHAIHGVSARQYLTNQGLNVNSGRRQFGAIAKLEEAGLTYQEIKIKLFSSNKGPSKRGSSSGSTGGSSSGSGSGSSKAKADPVKPKPKAKADKKPVKPSNNKVLTAGSNRVLTERTAAPKKERSKTGIRLTTPLQQDFIDASSDAQSRNGGRFTHGNAAAIVTGSYLDIVKIDPQIVDLIVNRPLGDVSGIVQLSELRFLQMQMMLDERLQHIETLAENDTLPRDADNNPIPKEDLLRDALWRATPIMTGLLGTLAMARTQAGKAAIDSEVKVERLTREREDRAFMIDLAKRRLEDESLTALDLAIQIEARGLKPSPILAAEALKEIELMKPKFDNSGISDEELAAEVERYQASTLEQVDSISMRNSQLAQMMLDSKAAIEAAGLGEEDFNESFAGMEAEEQGEDNALSIHNDDYDHEFDGEDEWDNIP